jgi:hypothetical protein
MFVQDANVTAGLSSSASSSDRSTATSSLLAALILSARAIALDLSSLLLGFTLFFDRLNVFHSVLHFFGGVLTAWYLIDTWGYTSLWWIFAIFCFVPALSESITLMMMFWFKVFRY